MLNIKRNGKTEGKEIGGVSRFFSRFFSVVFGTVFAGFFFSSFISVSAADDSRFLLYLPAIVSSHGQSTTNPPSTVTYGAVHAGQYHLGPVDFAETVWHNACAPAGGYRSELVVNAGLGGEYLVGVSNIYSEEGGVCDKCIFIKTAQEKGIIARVVTYGASNSPGDVDVSPSVYAALNKDEYPRSMTWQFVKCPESGPLVYEFQDGAHIWWSSLWVRNARVPVRKVEVKSANHAAFFALQRGTDGTVTDNGGFGAGPFTLRVTAIDGQVLEDTFPEFPTGQLIESQKQFK
jgi:expansin